MSTDKLVPILINLDTVDTRYGLQLEAADLLGWLAGRAGFVVEARTAEDVVVSQVGRDLCEKIFLCYTRKQWGLDPSELDASITARDPGQDRSRGSLHQDVRTAARTLQDHGASRRWIMPI